MSKPLFVTNLPPDCTEEDVWRSFSRFGTVWLVVMVEDHADDIRYFFRSAFVFYAARRSLAFFFEDDVDVLIHEYLIEVFPSDGPFVTQTAVILGVCRCLTELRIREEFGLTEREKVRIERFGEDFCHGYALIQFPNGETVMAFLRAHSSGPISFCDCGSRLWVRRFPLATPRPRVVTVGPNDVDFLRLYGLPRYSDYQIVTPDGEYRVSSRVFALCSGLVSRHISSPVPRLTTRLDISGDYESVIRAVYGAPLVITQSNAGFVHAFGAHFLIDSLILSAGLYLFEELTVDGAPMNARHLLEKGLDVRYLVEFIAMRFAESHQPLPRRLPIELVRSVARHPAMGVLTKEQIEGIFRFFLPPTNRAGISLSEIGCADIGEMDFESHRELLVDYLDHHRVHASGPQRGIASSRSAVPPPPRTIVRPAERRATPERLSGIRPFPSPPGLSELLGAMSPRDGRRHFRGGDGRRPFGAETSPPGDPSPPLDDLDW